MIGRRRRKPNRDQELALALLRQLGEERDRSVGARPAESPRRRLGGGRDQVGRAVLEPRPSIEVEHGVAVEPAAEDHTGRVPRRPVLDEPPGIGDPLSQRSKQIAKVELAAVAREDGAGLVVERSRGDDDVAPAVLRERGQGRDSHPTVGAVRRKEPVAGEMGLERPDRVAGARVVAAVQRGVAFMAHAVGESRPKHARRGNDAVELEVAILAGVTPRLASAEALVREGLERRPVGDAGTEQRRRPAVG